MSVIRAFIAINISPEIQHGLEQVSSQLKQDLAGAAVRWVPVPNIHLTLFFLGDVSIANLDLLIDNLHAEAIGHNPFEISVGKVGAFPGVQRPRVIWVGVEAPPALRAIQEGIEHRMTKLGYPREERSFSPHLTLGRVSRNITPVDVKKISQVLQASKVGFLGAAQVERIHLYRSDLNPDGAVYTVIHSEQLGI